jgi:hypothetical protein
LREMRSFFGVFVDMDMGVLYRDIDFKIMKESLNKILDSNESYFNKYFLNNYFMLYLRLKNERNKYNDFLKLIDFKAIKFNEEKNGESRSSEYADIDFYDITNEKYFKFGKRINESNSYISTIVNEKLKDYSQEIKNNNLYWYEQLYYEQILKNLKKKIYILEPIDELNKNLVDNKCYFLIRDIDAIYKKNTEKISKIDDIDALDNLIINDNELEIDDDEFGEMIKDGTFKYIGNYDSSNKKKFVNKIDAHKTKYKFYFSTDCDSLLGSIFIYNEKNNEYIINEELWNTVIHFGGKHKRKTHKKPKKKTKNTKRKHTKKYKN